MIGEVHEPLCITKNGTTALLPFGVVTHQVNEEIAVRITSILILAVATAKRSATRPTQAHLDIWKKIILLIAPALAGDLWTPLRIPQPDKVKTATSVTYTGFCTAPNAGSRSDHFRGYSDLLPSSFACR